VPADAVRSITYQKMIELFEAGELNDKQLDCFIAPRAAEELYDVVKDPYHFDNLAENPDYQKQLQEMSLLLDTWIEEYNDTVPQYPTPDKFDRWSGAGL